MIYSSTSKCVAARARDEIFRKAMKKGMARDEQRSRPSFLAEGKQRDPRAAIGGIARLKDGTVHPVHYARIKYLLVRVRGPKRRREFISRVLCTEKIRYRVFAGVLSSRAFPAARREKLLSSFPSLATKSKGVRKYRGGHSFAAKLNDVSAAEKCTCV